MTFCSEREPSLRLFFHLAVADSQVYTSALQTDMSMASQLLSPCITVLLEGLQGESQDEVKIAKPVAPELMHHTKSTITFDRLSP